MKKWIYVKNGDEKEVHITFEDDLISCTTLCGRKFILPEEVDEELLLCKICKEKLKDILTSYIITHLTS